MPSSGLESRAFARSRCGAGEFPASHLSPWGFLTEALGLMERPARELYKQIEGWKWAEGFWGRIRQLTKWDQWNRSILIPRPANSLIHTAAKLAPHATKLLRGAARVCGWKAFDFVPGLGTALEMLHSSELAPSTSRWFENDMIQRFNQGKDPFHYYSELQQQDRRRATELMSSGYKPFATHHPETGKPFGFASEMEPNAQLSDKYHWVFPAEVVTHSRSRPNQGQDPFHHYSLLPKHDRRRETELMSSGYKPFATHHAETGKPFGFASEMKPNAQLSDKYHWVFPAEVVTHSRSRPNQGEDPFHYYSLLPERDRRRATELMSSGYKPFATHHPETGKPFGFASEMEANAQLSSKYHWVFPAEVVTHSRSRPNQGEDPFHYYSLLPERDRRRATELMSSGYKPFATHHPETGKPFGFASEMEPNAQLSDKYHWVFPAEVVTHSHSRPFAQFGL